MHLFRDAFLIVAVLFIMASASAATLEATSSVYFFEKPAAISVEITNDSDISQSLSMQFYAPVDFEFVDNTDSIPSNGTQRVAIVMHPRKELLGSSYLSTLIVKVGEQTFVRSIELHFSEKKAAEEDSGQDETGEEDTESQGALAGFFSLFSLESWGFLGWELVLDVFLVIVAAILLIAFISRYSKISGGKR